MSCGAEGTEYFLSLHGMSVFTVTIRCSGADKFVTSNPSPNFSEGWHLNIVALKYFQPINCCLHTTSFLAVYRVFALQRIVLICLISIKFYCLTVTICYLLFCSLTGMLWDSQELFHSYLLLMVLSMISRWRWEILDHIEQVVEVHQGLKLKKFESLYSTFVI